MLVHKRFQHLASCELVHIPQFGRGVAIDSTGSILPPHISRKKQSMAHDIRRASEPVISRTLRFRKRLAYKTFYINTSFGSWFKSVTHNTGLDVFPRVCVLYFVSYGTVRDIRYKLEHLLVQPDERF